MHVVIEPVLEGVEAREASRRAAHGQLDEVRYALYGMAGAVEADGGRWRAAEGVGCSLRTLLVSSTHTDHGMYPTLVG